MILRKIIAFSAVLMLITASFASCEKAPYTGSVSVVQTTDTDSETTTGKTSASKEKTIETTTEVPYREPDIEKVSLPLPDLSELGIDVSTYPAEGEKYISEIGPNCEIGYKGERPKKTEIIFTNDDMNMLIFDGNGMLCFYDGPIISSADSPEMTLPDEDYKNMGLKYLQTIEPDFKGYDEESFDIDRENRRCTMTMKRTYGEDMHDRLKIIFDGSGLVYQFSIFRTGARDMEAPARLRQKVVDFGTEYCEKHFHNGSSVSDIAGECFEVDGIVYGQYSYIVNSGTAASPVYTTYEVIVRDE